jgi:hypothetical protein
LATISGGAWATADVGPVGILMSRSGFANRASSCAPWADVGERRAFLCGRWVLEVGIDWGMFSDILGGWLDVV